MPYETARLLAYQSFQQWISTQLFSFGWFFQVGLLIVAYTVWIKLVDKSRIKDLLLFGSLCAVAFGVMESLFVGFWGLWEFKINLFPMQPPHFVIGYTLGPIMHMLVQQYTSSWKKFLLWDCVGSAVMVFGILPIYSLLGILQLHNWNFYRDSNNS